MVSTSNAVFVIGGYLRKGKHIQLSRSVKRLERASGSWSSAPALPAGTFPLDGMAIDDVPYLVARHCRADRPINLGELGCAGVRVLHLPDGAHSWKTLTPPKRLKLYGDNVSTAGRVGDRGVAIVPGSMTDERALVVLDPVTGRWRSIPPPAGTGPALYSCLTLGRGYLLANGPARPPGLTTTTIPSPGASPPKQYSLSIWGLDGRSWRGPQHADLGWITPETNLVPSQFCGGGAFAAYNPDNGGRGIVAAMTDGRLVVRHLRMPPVRQGAPNPGPALVAMTVAGKLVMPPDFRQLTPKRLSSAATFVDASEAEDVVDVLVRLPGNGERVSVVSEPRP